MSITYGFYNSINSDRQYDAADMSRLFDGIINDGVFMSVGDAMFVIPSTGMNIIVGSGRAWFNHTWTLNSVPLLLTVDNAEVALNRIDTVVLEVDSSEAVRANSIKIIKGTPASNPVAPTLTTSELVNQHPLANIYVGVGVTEIPAAKITNKIGTTDCPFITGILATINSSALITQWQDEFDDDVAQWTNAFNLWFEATQDTLVVDRAQWSSDFNTWFASIEGILTGDLAGALASRIDTIQGTGWTNQTIKGTSDTLLTHVANNTIHGTIHDATLNLNYQWKINNGQLYIEEVS